MNISKSVSDQVSQMKSGHLFSYQDIDGYAAHGEAVVKAVSRHASHLGLAKVKKGLFYKVEQGDFGPMAPNNADIVKYFTVKKNKTFGYVTGPYLYHLWGLTTQLPAEIVIATSTNKREKISLSGLRVVTVPARDKVTKHKVPLLQFLDVVKSVDKILDANPKTILAKLVKRLNTYTPAQLSIMEDIAQSAYTAKTKALLGALLESQLGYFSHKLHSTLNPTSKFKVALFAYLPNSAKRWQLVPL
jgi:hypothetical protein